MASGKKLNTKEFIEKSNLKHNWKYDYNRTVYAKAKEKVCIVCPIHGEFWQKADKHMNEGCGCPFCNESKLEKEVEKLLTKNDITFERQKKFDWLGRQSLDFYLPKYNIAIECQGEQHFKPVDFGGKGIKWAIEQFQYNVKKDEIKKQKCENNGVKLLYYSNSNKNIIL